jgi:hypothetical protein
VPEVIVSIISSFTSGSTGTTLNVQLQGAPDNGSGAPGGWLTIFESGIQYLGQLTAGQKILQSDLAAVAEAYLKPSPVTTFSASAASGTINVASATGIQFGQLAVPAIPRIITPGTTVTGIVTNTISLSQNTVNSAPAGTAIAFNAGFGTGVQGGFPRFNRLNYVVASGPFTGGSLSGGLILKQDRVPLYAPGYSWPLGSAA